MKKFVLIAGAATLIFPTLAHAKGEGHHYTYKKVDMSKSADNRDEYRIEMKSEQNFITTNRAANRSFMAVGGETLLIEGDSVYKVMANGQRFFAPNGSYPTQSGQTVVVYDGQLARIETPGEIITIN